MNNPANCGLPEPPPRGTDAVSLRESFLGHVKYSLAKDCYSATQRDYFRGLAYTVLDQLVERWITTQQTYYNQDAKRVYYLSMEFLTGRVLGNALLNLSLHESISNALSTLGQRLEDLREFEWDAGLGNGGLGRLAACYLDSMATLELPAYGYGIRYEYGMFLQRLADGYQIEVPDTWLRYGNPWELERAEYLYPVRFNGRVVDYTDEQGRTRHQWIDTEEVLAMAYDTPVPGYRNNTVNNMRLWSARATREFNLEFFNDGDYERAMEERVQTETLSKVLYPDDSVARGRELRLKQEYFLVSATLQDILRRYRKTHPEGYDELPDKVAIQLNDTHPAIGVAELMRILVDQEGLGWDRAWSITRRVFAFTNHTIMPEALERWPVDLLGRLLPRHLQIIYEINHFFLEEVSRVFPGDIDRLRRMSLIEESGCRQVRMAHLAIVGSQAVNGVSAMHTEIIRREVFRDFHDLWPERFVNVTNGVTPRRWLALCNPALAELVTETAGPEWPLDLGHLRRLTGRVGDPGFARRWRDIKHANKVELAAHIQQHCGLAVDPSALFDCQVKRIHEYKRQLLNVLHVIARYNRIKDNPGGDHVPRLVLFAGKAAPAYTMAKLLIKLINNVAAVVNADPIVGDRLKVVFVPNYGVTLAERIIPAADLSEQISTAGTEASGTGNMKFALNGALTIGTLDGANVEIRREVGEENFFAFGLDADGVAEIWRRGYRPGEVYAEDGELRRVLDMIQNGYFSSLQPELFQPVVRRLLLDGDPYLVLADFRAYLDAQAAVDQAWRDPDRWTAMSIHNAAGMGFFSSDRSVADYNRQIWNTRPIPIQLTGGR